MRLLVLACATLLTSASAAAPAGEPEPPAQSGRSHQPARIVDPNADAPEACPPVSRYHAMKEGARLGLKRLDELPDADHYKAAYRKIDGCEAPIVANFGVARR